MFLTWTFAENTLTLFWQLFGKYHHGSQRIDLRTALLRCYLNTNVRCVVAPRLLMVRACHVRVRRSRLSLWTISGPRCVAATCPPQLHTKCSFSPRYTHFPSSITLVVAHAIISLVSLVRLHWPRPRR